MSILEYSNKLRFYNHLKDRGVGVDTQCWIDWNSERVWFPLWSVNGRLIGYQRYSWQEEKVRSNRGKYFTWITEEYKPLACWGLSQLSLARRPAISPSQPILVVEGIFDALRCVEAGYVALGVLGATPSKQFVSWFKMLLQGRNTIAILDNDENNAGCGLTKLCTSAIMCEWYKDMGDHNKHEAKRWLHDKISKTHLR